VIPGSTGFSRDNRMASRRTGLPRAALPSGPGINPAWPPVPCEPVSLARPTLPAADPPAVSPQEARHA
jgi:hypothetical protein